MRIISWFVLSLVCPAALLTTASVAQQTLAQEKRTTFTGNPPTFVNAGTPSNYVNRLLAAYYFTIHLPATSIESLRQITIQQQISPETIQFNLERTEAFQDGQKPKKTLNIQNTSFDPKTQTVSVTFDPPISPGTTFTILLEAQRNPSLEGVYLFDITAFPAGVNPSPLTLGTGRFHFYTRL